MNYHVALYALGAILLGVLGITFHDFHLQWQAVPESIPRIPYAYVSAAILALAGCALLVRRYERIGALTLAVFYGLWVFAFHLPSALAAWRIMGVWNPPAEITFMTMGGLAFWAASAGPASGVLKRITRVLAGASAIVFGLVHMSYIKETAGFVPAWIPPSQVFWAWATGAGHIAAGVALVTGIQARLAATALTGMMASFVLLVHIPRIISTPDSRFEWTMLGFAASLTGAAWLIRKYST